MKQRTRIIVVIAALLGAGAARIPFEQELSTELRDARLLPPELRIGTRERIGQTSSAVALGGLRTLVATFMHLRAFGYFSELRWPELEDTFGIIVDLAPHSGFYWNAGASHLAYDASAYYLDDEDLSPLRREESSRIYIRKGRAFLERGIRNNPDDWRLRTLLGTLLTDPLKARAFPDQAATFQAAADAYHGAVATGRAPAYVRRAEFLARARIPGREKEALEMARELERIPGNRQPTVLAARFALEMREDPSRDADALARELFRDDKTAYDVLSSYWLRTSARFPVDGVAAALQALENRLRVPPGRSVLGQVPPE